MSRRTVILGVAVLVIARFCISTAFTGGEWQWWPLPSMRTVDTTPGWTSDVGFDGSTSVWIEAPSDDVGGPGTARLAIRARSASETTYCDIPEMIAEAGTPDASEYDRWLIDGPHVHGDYVAYRLDNGPDIGGDAGYAVRIDDCSRDRVFDSADWRQYRFDAVAMALHSGSLYWSDGRGADHDIWRTELTSGRSELVVGGAGDQYQPAVSAEWIVWKHAADDSGDAEVRSRQLSGGDALTIGRVTSYRPLVISGDRAAWYGYSPDELDTTAIQVYDLSGNRVGHLNSSPWVDEDMLAMSPDVLVRTIRVADEGASAHAEVQVHDAGAISSYANLHTYLTGYYVTRTASDYVRPVAAGSLIQWTDSQEPDDNVDYGDDGGARIMEALVTRSAAFFPHIVSD